MNRQRHNIVALKMHLPDKEIGSRLGDPVGQSRAGLAIQRANAPQHRAHKDELGRRRAVRAAQEAMAGAEELDGAERVGLEVGAQGSQRGGEDGGVAGRGAGVGDEDVEGVDAVGSEGLRELSEGVVGGAVQRDDEEGAGGVVVVGAGAGAGAEGEGGWVVWVAHAGYDGGVGTLEEGLGEAEADAWG